MNKRIQKLFNEAGFHQPEMERLGIEDKFEKFAQLIIRECMDLLEDYTTDVHVGGIAYNVLSAEETLQKHFGVESD